jgi:hypothetical protein
VKANDHRNMGYDANMPNKHYCNKQIAKTDKHNAKAQLKQLPRVQMN